jgi:hypothetical protein
MDDDLSRGDRRRIHTALAIFAGIVAIAIVAAFTSTIHVVHTSQTGSDLPPGTIGLAHPHPPLDKGPGNAVTFK